MSASSKDVNEPMRDWMTDALKSEWGHKAPLIVDSVLRFLTRVDYIILQRHTSYDRLQSALEIYLKPGGWKDISEHNAQDQPPKLILPRNDQAKDS